MKTISKRNKIAAAIFLVLGLLSLALGVWLWGAPAAVQAAETEHDQMHTGWTKLTEGDGTLSEGNYYLSGDLNADLIVSGNATVTLCLNGAQNLPCAIARRTQTTPSVKLHIRRASSRAAKQPTAAAYILTAAHSPCWAAP